MWHLLRWVRHLLLSGGKAPAPGADGVKAQPSRMGGRKRILSPQARGCRNRSQDLQPQRSCPGLGGVLCAQHPANQKDLGDVKRKLGSLQPGCIPRGTPSCAAGKIHPGTKCAGTRNSDCPANTVCIPPCMDLRRYMHNSRERLSGTLAPPTTKA